jgi:hypothetical protein
LNRPDVDALLPKDPSLMSGLVNERSKIDSGCRSLECGLLWCAIASASQYMAADVQQARTWFKRAVAWLPNEQDIEVLLQWAHFERETKDTQSVMEVSRLLSEARARVERVTSLSAEDRVRVWLESADNEMDRAGIPRLEGASHDLSQPAPFGSALGVGSQSGGSALDQCKQYLGRAQDAVERFPAYYRQDFAGSADMVRYAPLHFRVQCAFARMHLGVDRRNAEQSILQALGEHAACSSLQFVRGGAGGGVRVVLQSDWSRLEIAGTELTAADRQLAQTLRLRLVDFCIEEAEAAPSFDSLGRQSRWRDAAWLLCRYWASTDSARLTGEVLNTDRLAELSRRVVGRSLGTASLGMQPSGWDPETFEDRAVSAELQRRIRQEPAPPAAPPTQSNLICRAVVKTVGSRQGGTPVVEEVRVYDAGPAASDYSGFLVSVDPGGGATLRRQGVFGYGLRTDHHQALGKPATVEVGDALAATGRVVGSVHELARINFDGIAPFGPGFDVVVRKRDGGEYKRLRVDGVAVEGNGYLAPVDLKAIVNGRLNIQMAIAALAIPEQPTPAGVQSALLLPLMTFFEQELGEALSMIQEQMGVSRTSVAVGLDTSFGFFGEEFMVALSDDLARGWVNDPGPRALNMPKHALSQLDASVKQALARFVEKFQKSHPQHKLHPAVVAELGLSKVAPSAGARPSDGSAWDTRTAFNAREWAPQTGSYAPPAAHPVSDELRARFADLLAGLSALNIGSNGWGMARDRVAVHGMVSEMIVRLRSALGTAFVGGTEHQRLRDLLYRAEDLHDDLS